MAMSCSDRQSPLPGESAGEFDERVVQECRQACIDQFGEEQETGNENMSPIGGSATEKIRQCQHACQDRVWDDVDWDDFDEE